MHQTQLLVIGAGPYALSVAALARERGIGTVVLGRPMGFWRLSGTSSIQLWSMSCRLTLTINFSERTYGPCPAELTRIALSGREA